MNILFSQKYSQTFLYFFIELISARLHTHRRYVPSIYLLYSSINKPRVYRSCGRAILIMQRWKMFVCSYPAPISFCAKQRYKITNSGDFHHFRISFCSFNQVQWQTECIGFVNVKASCLHLWNMLNVIGNYVILISIQTRHKRNN
jgi:hypothetical protein